MILGHNNCNEIMHCVHQLFIIATGLLFVLCLSLRYIFTSVASRWRHFKSQDGWPLQLYSLSALSPLLNPPVTLPALSEKSKHIPNNGQTILLFLSFSAHSRPDTRARGRKLVENDPLSSPRPPRARGPYHKGLPPSYHHHSPPSSSSQTLRSSIR